MSFEWSVWCEVRTVLRSGVKEVYIVLHYRVYLRVYKYIIVHAIPYSTDILRYTNIYTVRSTYGICIKVRIYI